MRAFACNDRLRRGPFAEEGISKHALIDGEDMREPLVLREPGDEPVKVAHIGPDSRLDRPAHRGPAHRVPHCGKEGFGGVSPLPADERFARRWLPGTAEPPRAAMRMWETSTLWRNCNKWGARHCNNRRL